MPYMNFLESRTYSLVRLGLLLAGFFFGIVVLAISGSIISDGWGYSRVNFLLFCGIFVLIFSTIPLAVTTFRPSITKSFGTNNYLLYTIIVDGLAWIFLFAGGCALAADFGSVSCKDYDLTDGFASVIIDFASTCKKAKADSAMAFLGWVVFLALFVFDVFELINLKNSGQLSFGAFKSGSKSNAPVVPDIENQGGSDVENKELDTPTTEPAEPIIDTTVQVPGPDTKEAPVNPTVN